MSLAETRDDHAFDRRWETQVYGAGRHLNRYPSNEVVSFVFAKYGGAENRSTIRFLDVGCGAGNNAWFLAREGFAVAGIDGSETAIAYARDRLTEDGLAADLRQGDFRALPWDDAAFDCVIDRNAITHNRRAAIAATLDEVRRVLKPGGRFLSLMYSHDHPARSHGEPLGDGSYANFTGGYFADIALTFFATAQDVAELFAPRFSIAHQYVDRIDDFGTGEAIKHMWRLECVK